MTFPVLGRWLTDSRRALVGWSLALTFVVLMYLPLYPSMNESGVLQESFDSLPPDLADALGMTAMSDGPGYAQSTVFGLLGMLLLTVAAIGAGARAVAGDEERGGLELTIAHAVSRRRVVLERAAAITLVVLGLAALVGVVAGLVESGAGLGLTLAGLVGGTLAMAGLALVHGTVALTVGAATGRRAMALSAAAGVAVLGYLANNLGPRLGDGVQAASPFHWAYGADPLRNGPDPAGLGLLALAVVVLVGLAVVLLERRDVGV
jgi:ABC-2 type transport system permease protein